MQEHRRTDRFVFAIVDPFAKSIGAKGALQFHSHINNPIYNNIYNNVMLGNVYAETIPVLLAVKNASTQHPTNVPSER